MKVSILAHTDLKIYKDAGIGVYRWKDYTGELPSSVCSVSQKISRALGQVPGDGNVYDHQRHQARIIRNYGVFDIGHPSLLESGILGNLPLSHMEHFQLRVTGLVHDLGETHPNIGDVCSDKKHLARHSKEEEFQAGTSVIASIIKSPELYQSAIDCYALDFDEQHRLYKIFKMYEKLSYISGAIYTLQNAQGGKSIARPAHLMHNVLKNQMIPLMQWYLQDTPSVVAFINTHQEEINGLFSYVVSSKFSDEIEENNIKFKEAYDVWVSFWGKKANNQ